MPLKQPDPVGKCPICTINLYGKEETPIQNNDGKDITIIGKPLVMPCGVGLYRPPIGTKGLQKELVGSCPWETESEQHKLEETSSMEKIAGVLGTMHTND